MPKYYEGEAIVKAFTETTNQSETWARGILASMKEADVAPIVHGHWIYMDTYRTVSRYKCSECERVVTQKENSCPRCFARMDEEVKE